ncbi:hypothetical protein BKA56DRAFT_600978 [Ilyonectria sp. MPI-CAGE-AT-0026]|nr:hypothetical protein BKA56DRAFT_600978 [Ilyonectria sp. MPI-CAGE-AT-0026]
MLIEGGLKQLQSSHQVVSSMQYECYKLDEPNDPSLYPGIGGDNLGITEVLKSVRGKYNHLESTVRLSRAAIEEDIKMFDCWLAAQKSEIGEKKIILQRMITMQDMNSTGNYMDIAVNYPLVCSYAQR